MEIKLTKNNNILTLFKDKNNNDGNIKEIFNYNLKK